MNAMELKAKLDGAIPDWGRVQEIRIRAGKPVLWYGDGKEQALTGAGMSAVPDSQPVLADTSLIKEILGMISGHSLYAYEDEIRQGFLTMEGGHRVGLCGTAVLGEDQTQGAGASGTRNRTGPVLRTIKDISGLNIRLARQKIGCADRVMPWLYVNGRIQNTLFLSPPGAGKTTMLRDVIRQVSDGNLYGRGQTVSVVDERSEIGACMRGIPQCDLGMRTDVMDRCPKTQGMLMMLRSMAPKVMAVDEIGTRADADALREVLKCGCRILATVHGDEVGDMRKKPVLKDMAEEGMFSRYVVLAAEPCPGTIRGIYDEKFRRLDREEEMETCAT